MVTDVYLECSALNFEGQNAQEDSQTSKMKAQLSSDAAGTTLRHIPEEPLSNTVESTSNLGSFFLVHLPYPYGTEALKA